MAVQNNDIQNINLQNKNCSEQRPVGTSTCTQVAS